MPVVVIRAPPQRKYLPKILQTPETIDLAIPRSSKGLIDFVHDNVLHFVTEFLYPGR